MVTQKKIRVGLLGACGRMGRKNAALILRDPELEITAAWDREGSEGLGVEIAVLAGDEAVASPRVSAPPVKLDEACDVVVDFSHPSATLGFLDLAVKGSLPLVIGTTGFSTDQLKKIEVAAKTVPLVMSGNFSTGINLLMGLVRRCAALLDASYNIEIVEQHHNQKIDAPSGTAKMLGEAAGEGRGVDLERSLVNGRQGEVGVRPPGEIGMFSIRGGAVVGQHDVFFIGEHERLDLSHQAFSREAFSTGVLLALKWVVKQKPGKYTMLDVLDLK